MKRYFRWLLCIVISGLLILAFKYIDDNSIDWGEVRREQQSVIYILKRPGLKDEKVNVLEQPWRGRPGTAKVLDTGVIIKFLGTFSLESFSP